MPLRSSLHVCQNCLPTLHHLCWTSCLSASGLLDPPCLSLGVNIRCYCNVHMRALSLQLSNRTQSSSLVGSRRLIFFITTCPLCSQKEPCSMPSRITLSTPVYTPPYHCLVFCVAVM